MVCAGSGLRRGDHIEGPAAAPVEGGGRRNMNSRGMIDHGQP